jgi:hypothetical protein
LARPSGIDDSNRAAKELGGITQLSHIFPLSSRINNAASDRRLRRIEKSPSELNSPINLIKVLDIPLALNDGNACLVHI